MTVKVLLLTQWFDPEPTFKGLAFAKELKKQNVEVEVITGFPNYPGGKVYEGYKISFFQRELCDGIAINRVPLYPHHGRSALKRVFNYISFFLSSMIYGIFRRQKVDVIYAYHPPLTTALSASIISLLRRTPFVVDIQDLWPDTLASTGMLTNKKLLNVVNCVCNFVYRRATKIVVLSPGFKERLVSRGVPAEKIEIIYNWSDEENLRYYHKSSVVLPDGKFNVVFAGNLGLAQGLPSIVAAAKLLQEDGVNVNIILVGSGLAKPDAEKMVSDQKIDNVIFIPRVPPSEIGDILQQSDALLVHLINDELFSITIPSRTQAYLACGKPIIMAVDGDAASLITKANAGVTCEPGNPASIASGIKYLTSLTSDELAALGGNGSAYYNEKLCLSAGVKKFIDIFNQVAK
ncbi:glycosyltransferase family 4 protein [Citrobacter freundii]|uniref:Glycosyltransferase family 4 protein n=1 Tax=Citrobacter freundii TaxID=546 RepID=A0AAE7GUT5_CITFR|nr:glycosyltransferase family 4 protein [Citrobacter freundii]QLO14647.1 glycosyltransferase family 4 protein [Citrobacter freundii]QLO42241.1 glycosyltransferase family 4 protein [Citrobacter freundii]QLV40405.1 glycosyltransferase family 4 protein [Citrobacter freundii]